MRAHAYFATIAAAWLALAVAGVGADAPPKPDAALQEKNRVAARAADAENAARFKDRADVLVLPGLVADRTEKSVRVRAAFTGLSGTEPAEFFLVPDNGEKDYEALAASFAKVADIARALEFIGLPPGRPVDSAKFRFWPKGERVRMTFRWQSADGKPLVARAEEMMVDDRTNAPLPQTGFVYVGNLATLGEANFRSIASNYNEPYTLLDLPRQALQGEVYGTQKLNPKFSTAAAQPTEIVFEPESKGRVLDLTLRISESERAPAFTLEGGDAPMTTSAAGAVREFARLSAAGRDVFLTVQLDPKLSVATVRNVWTLLAGLEGENGIRIEPTSAEEPFFRAFVPPLELRDPSKITLARWTLHLQKTASGIDATLAQHAGKDDEKTAPSTWKIGKPEEVAAALAKTQDASRALIFTPGELSYGDLLPFVRPFLTKRSFVFIYPAASNTKSDPSK